MLKFSEKITLSFLLSSFNSLPSLIGKVVVFFIFGIRPVSNFYSSLINTCLDKMGYRNDLNDPLI